jgi:cobalt-precorrin 5A hydrolase
MENIEAAVFCALKTADCSIKELRLVATVDAKENESGILRFCEKYGLVLKVISCKEIKESKIKCKESGFVKKTLGIGAVALPCALLGGSKTQLLTDRISCLGVTVALARENCSW